MRKGKMREGKAGRVLLKSSCMSRRLNWIWVRMGLIKWRLGVADLSRKERHRNRPLCYPERPACSPNGVANAAPAPRMPAPLIQHSAPAPRMQAPLPRHLACRHPCPAPRMPALLLRHLAYRHSCLAPRMRAPLPRHLACRHPCSGTSHAGNRARHLAYRQSSLGIGHDFILALRLLDWA